MLTREILFGMNIVTLGGFAVMLLSLQLGRTRQIKPPLAYVGMAIGTMLVFAGLYVAGRAG